MQRITLDNKLEQTLINLKNSGSILHLGDLKHKTIYIVDKYTQGVGIQRSIKKHLNRFSITVSKRVGIRESYFPVTALGKHKVLAILAHHSERLLIIDLRSNRWSKYECGYYCQQYVIQ